MDGGNEIININLFTEYRFTAKDFVLYFSHLLFKVIPEYF